MVPRSLLLLALISTTILFLQVCSAPVQTLRIVEPEIGCSACYFSGGNMTIRMEHELINRVFYNNHRNPIHPAQIEAMGETASTRIICRLICGLITGYDTIPHGFRPWRQPDGCAYTQTNHSLQAATAEPGNLHQRETRNHYNQVDLPMDNPQTDIVHLSN